MDADKAAGPVKTRDRLAILDVLRGFALLGVIISNYVWSFSGYSIMPADARTALPSAAIDPLAEDILTFLVDSKFISILSFLFGVGFALQMDRLNAGGAAVRGIFVRRLLWLFVFGILHAVFLFFGDILHLYAVLGLALLFWRSQSGSALLVFGLIFAVFVPALIYYALWALPGLTDGAVNPAEGIARRWDEADAFKQDFAGADYRAIVVANAADFWAWLTSDAFLATASSSFGRFLLGLWAGRAALFVRTTAGDAGALAVMRYLLIAGAAVGIYCHTHVVVTPIVPEFGSAGFMSYAVDMGVWYLGVLAFASAYVGGIVLLFQWSFGRRVLMVFAPVGRMALTNYLGHSVIGFFVFYGVGLGLYGTVGPAAVTAIGIAAFCVLTGLSWLWLAVFAVGPAEWLWRSLTYGRVQSFRT